jgi:hypothetical protein
MAPRLLGFRDPDGNPYEITTYELRPAARRGSAPAWRDGA